jgi:DUF971 family protein
VEFVTMSSPNSTSAASVWPVSLKVDAAKRVLTIEFDNGETYAIEAELLRTHSPSAEVQGHSPDQRVTQWGKRNVKIRDMVATGNYAVRIAFDDGHDTGIFTWAHLRELGRDGPALWEAYLLELETKGLTRG